MPTFRVWPREPTTDDDVFCVYAIDDWDARDQIAATLGFDTRNEAFYDCEEDPSVTVQLSRVAHKDGSFTMCATHNAIDTPGFQH